MERVVVLGAGKIGSAIAHLLAESEWGGYKVVLADQHEEALKASGVPESACKRVDVADRPALANLLKTCGTVVSALSFTHNPAVAQAALEAGCSYFDLTEDVETTRKVKTLAEKAADNQVFMPQCGLAPGFISVAAADVARRFDKLDSVHMRVGALPLFPSNMLKYNLTWSTDGLINEYCNPCEALVDGRLREVQALEGHEYVQIDGEACEAFNTSGGLGTLCESLQGKVRELNYKTIRYPGHRQLAHFLINELRLREDRGLLRTILERSVPATRQDVVIIFCSATGWIGGRLEQVTDVRKVYHGKLAGRDWSAIQLTTAAGLCAMVDLHAQGHFHGKKGLLRQEDVALEEFLGNRFGCIYDTGGRSPVRTEEGFICIHNSPNGHAAEEHPA